MAGLAECGGGDGWGWVEGRRLMGGGGCEWDKGREVATAKWL